MKMVICGKGGSGKSTIVSLLAGEYIKEGRKVLVVDTDESNAGLNRILGMQPPKDLMEYFGGKREMMDGLRKSEKEGQEVSMCNWTIDEIPGGYITKKGSLGLVAIGKIHEPGEGCACPMGVLSKKFLSDLKTEDDEVVIIDTEAGIEHFGRGVDGVCDVILMVVDPSYESLRLSKDVKRMSGVIDLPLYYILNKTDDTTSGYLRDNIDDKEKIIAEFKQNPEILSAGLLGKEVEASVPAVFDIIKKLGAQA
ncbi:CO dehydrogenase maturation factor [Methanomicrobium sp. W14]|uniref:ATP-binding protein n=1 Tax=Methanomicrobium sp. W14 TaxID=2817839 RepID=UPI001AE1E615|nr:AAA family ATPase [Methanomicrobium sp. W14]MBP2134404.1 CO dehydrogenase maturation factor [Methanomicrobium sp. W14]